MEALQRRSFASWQEARAALDGVARDLGYSFVIHQKKPSAADPRRIVLHCARGRDYRQQRTAGLDPSRRRRRTNSQMCNCPSTLVIKRPRGPASPWVVAVTNARHNHEPGQSGAFARYRRQALHARQADVVRHFNEGLGCRQILAALRAADDPHLQLATRMDVQNLLNRHKAKLEARLATPSSPPPPPSPSLTNQPAWQRKRRTTATVALSAKPNGKRQETAEQEQGHADPRPAARLDKMPSPENATEAPREPLAHLRRPLNAAACASGHVMA